MKKLLISIGIGVLLVGCNITKQTASYKTLYSLEQTSTAAIDGFFRGVSTGAYPTNDVPIVSRAYNQLQSDIALASVLTQAGTNALATSSLLNEASAFINVVTTAKSLHK